jgi:hypothetical protein
MAQYGQVLDGGYEPEKDYVYTLFVNYFNNPTMTKIKNINNNYSMYGCKVYCLLSKECRYIIAITYMDTYSFGTVEELKNIKWISLQTRTLSEQYNVETHVYEPKAEGHLATGITRVKKDNNSSTYESNELPIIITLLHTQKKSNYQDKGTIVVALETWETIVTFV